MFVLRTKYDILEAENRKLKREIEELNQQVKNSEELISELQQNYSVIIVTHSMQQAARVSQRTAFFHLGNLVEYGETGKIFTNPEDSRTESYISGRIG